MARYNHITYYKEQYSTDSGVTWIDVSPITYRAVVDGTYDTIEECYESDDNYKAIFYREDGEIWYYPCDGDEVVSNFPAAATSVNPYSLVKIGKCVTAVTGFYMAHVRRVEFAEDGNLKRIEDECFSNSGLGYGISGYRLRIPDTVEYIGRDAFDCTSVSIYDIGNSVNYIGYGAWQRPKNDKIIYFNNPVAPTIDDSGNPPGKTFVSGVIQVPCGSENDYYNAISSANDDGVVRETIFSYRDLYEKCGEYNALCIKNDGDFEISRLRPGNVASVDSGITGCENIEFSTLSSKTAISKTLTNRFNLKRLNVPSQYSDITFQNIAIDFLNFSNIANLRSISYSNIGYLIIGNGVQTTMPESSLASSTVGTLVIGENGISTNYSGIGGQVERLILRETLPENVTINPNMLGNPTTMFVTAGEVNKYRNAYPNRTINSIGNIISTSWNKVEYQYEKVGDKYFAKLFEYVVTDTGLEFYTGNYRLDNTELIPVLVSTSATTTDWETGRVYSAAYWAVQVLTDTVFIDKPSTSRIELPNERYLLRMSYTYSYDTSVTSYFSPKVSAGTVVTQNMTSGKTPYMKSLQIYDNGMTEIGNYGLGNMYQNYRPVERITEITLPDTVTKIGDFGLSNNYGVTGYTFGTGLTSIGKYVFGTSSNITLTCKATTPPSVSDCLFNISYRCGYDYLTAIYVPSESVDAYKNAAIWRIYADKIFPIPT